MYWGQFFIFNYSYNWPTSHTQVPFFIFGYQIPMFVETVRLAPCRRYSRVIFLLLLRVLVETNPIVCGLSSDSQHTGCTAMLPLVFPGSVLEVSLTSLCLDRSLKCRRLSLVPSAFLSNCGFFSCHGPTRDSSVATPTFYCTSWVS